MNIQKIEIPCGRIVLEGMISIPDGPGTFGLVLICHPHPLYGGNMFNNVVHALSGSLETKGLAWLKFNFRGVGRSGGKFADGIGEQEDARAALSCGEKQDRIAPERIGIAGYSFGSTVAFAVAAKDPRVRAAAGISPFIQPPGLLDRCLLPKFFATGARDEFVDPQALGEQVKRLPGPKELVVFPGADHFWTEEEGAMAEKAGDFFKRNLDPAARESAAELRASP